MASQLLTAWEAAVESVPCKEQSKVSIEETDKQVYDLKQDKFPVSNLPDALS